MHENKLGKLEELKDLLKVVSVLGAVSGRFLGDCELSEGELVKFFVKFVQHNSCGGCVPCRVGTKYMEKLLEEGLKTGLKKEDRELLRLVAEDIGFSSRCDLGKLAGKLVKYALEYGLIEIKDKGGC